MGRLLFFYNDELGKELDLTEKFEYKSDTKVKIQVAQKDPTKLASGKDGKVVMQYPRIFIDDNGIVLKNASPTKLMGSN